VGLTGGDFQHLLPLHQTIAAQQNHERIEWIRHDRWINHTKCRFTLITTMVRLIRKMLVNCAVLNTIIP